MIGALKYIKGYVRIKVWGFSPERFMNLCSNRDLLLWDIVKEGEAYYMNISLRGFYQLRPVVRKTGTKVVIQKRYGLPFFVPVIWARKIFVIGCILCVSFWIWSSAFIWDIQVAGNYQITDDVFRSFLKEQNIGVGMKKGSLDIESLEKEIRRQFPAVTWTSAKLDGTRLLVEIKENDAPIITPKEEIIHGTDLVAQYEGVVTAMIVRSGVPKVAIGESVEKGQILVEGKVPVYNEDATVRAYQYVEADADIYLEHVINYKQRLPFDYIRKEYTGRTRKRHFLRIGEKEWKIPMENPFLVYDYVIRESRPLIFEKLSVPVFWGDYTYREYQDIEYEYSLKQAEEILNGKINNFIKTLKEKGVQIIEKNVKIDTNSGTWVVFGDFQVIEKIGKSQPTAVEELLPENADTGENGTDE